LAIGNIHGQGEVLLAELATLGPRRSRPQIADLATAQFARLGR
jgi:hypothetical protein